MGVIVILVGCLLTAALCLSVKWESDKAILESKRRGARVDIADLFLRLELIDRQDYTTIYHHTTFKVTRLSRKR